MGQNDIYQFLKKNKDKWFTSREISEGLSVGTSSISTCLKRLRRFRQVEFKKSPKSAGIYLYKVK